MDFSTSKRPFDLLVAPLMSFLPQVVLTHNADYRTHKFHAIQHVLLTIFAQLTNTESANQLLDELNEVAGTQRSPNLREPIGFNFIDVDRPVQLHQSSFSRANHNRSYRLCFGGIVFISFTTKFILW